MEKETGKLSLHPQHLADLQKSELSDETIKAAGIYSVRPSDISKKLGWNGQGIESLLAFPYSGCNEFERYKPFYHPEYQGKKPKYLQRKDSGNYLYIPETVRAILQDANIPIYFTEGEKKTLKACQEGLYCIGLSGLWNWKLKDGGLIPDFDKITFTDRAVYIIPDNDWQKPDKHGYDKNLDQAVYGLAYKLKHRGARVFIVELPDGGEK